MTTKRYRISALLGFITFTLAATGIAQQGGRGQQPAPLQLTVSGFADGSEMPLKYTCYGQPAGVSPAIEWKSVPPGTQSFLLLMHDLEPHPGKGLGDITHWLIWNVPGTATGLPEGVPAAATLPDNAHQLKRGNGREALAGYFGPCAPPGTFHHYAWELWALDKLLDVPADATRADVMKAADGHILGSAEWFGLLHTNAAQPPYAPK